MAIDNDRTFYLVQKAEVGKNQSENISRLLSIILTIILLT